MSAPWEVWCRIDRFNGHTLHGVRKSREGSDGSIDDNPTRYLRADLTCGECAFLKEDSDYSVLCVKHSWEIAAENPACMAFVPKHDRKGER